MDYNTLKYVDDIGNFYSRTDDGEWNHHIVMVPSSRDSRGDFYFNSSNDFMFWWSGVVHDNPNLDSEEAESQIFVRCLAGGVVRESEGKNGRAHLAAEPDANHVIAPGTNTGDLYLLRDDGEGREDGTVGRCPNLYLSKAEGLTVGGRVMFSGTATDGGCPYGIAVAPWGDYGMIVMRCFL